MTAAHGGLLDNHAHSLLRNFLKLDVRAFRACWSESRSEAMLEQHVQHHMHYQQMLAELGELLGANGEQEIIAKRRSFGSEAEYARMLLREAGVGTIVVDDGFRGDVMYSLSELQQLLGDEVEIRQCRRIETVLEQCIGECTTFGELHRTFLERIFARGGGISLAGLKTIMAYRGGLDLDFAVESAAENNFIEVKEQFASSRRRITRCPLYHYFLILVFQMAGSQGLPVQVHTGLGDDDADLIGSNPALMQKLFRMKPLANTTWILLHCYPYVREAAFMCALYENVYMDLSLALNLVSPIAGKLVEEALACAPASKLLYGSDGHSIPETHWHAALTWRRASRW